MSDIRGSDFPGTGQNSKRPPPELPSELKEERDAEGEVPVTISKSTPAGEPSAGVDRREPAAPMAPPPGEGFPESPGEVTSAPQRGAEGVRRKLTNAEANWAMSCHLAAVFGYISFIGFVVGPLVVWLFKKNEDPYLDAQGKEAVNFQLSMILYYIGAFILSFVLIGIPLLIALFIFQLVEIILASVRAKEGVLYKYPLTIRFIS